MWMCFVCVSSHKYSERQRKMRNDYSSHHKPQLKKWVSWRIYGTDLKVILSFSRINKDVGKNTMCPLMKWESQAWHISSLLSIIIIMKNRAIQFHRAINIHQFRAVFLCSVEPPSGHTKQYSSVQWPEAKQGPITNPPDQNSTQRALLIVVRPSGEPAILCYF